MIHLKGSPLLPVPQKTQCLRDLERIYTDKQQHYASHFLLAQERIARIAKEAACLP